MDGATLQVRYEALERARGGFTDLAGRLYDLGASIATRAAEVNPDTVGDDDAARQFHEAFQHVIDGYTQNMVPATQALAQIMRDLEDKFQQLDESQRIKHTIANRP